MIAFWILALLLVASAVFVITAEKPVYSVVGLMLNFVVLAAMYLTLSAEFLAVIQVIVYAGAVLVLFLFVIALLSSGTRPFDVGPDKMPKALWPALGLIALALFDVVYGASRGSSGAAATAPPATSTLGPAGTADVFGSVADFGHALLTTNLLPFEITALVLMVAVIGVVVLAGDVTPARITGRPRRGAGVRPPREPIVKEVVGFTSTTRPVEGGEG